VIVSSVGYHYGKGDFMVGECLANVPHVVVASSDFYSLWMRIGFFDSTAGLTGNKALEYRPMPSPTWGIDYGYILIRPKDRSYRIVLNPIVLNEYHRIIKTLTQFPSPHGVVSQEVDDDKPYSWLGGMGPWTHKPCDSRRSRRTDEITLPAELICAGLCSGADATRVP
jgi:hypothetical protein